MSGGARYVVVDLRFAVRKLRKAPGYTAAAVLTLALSIGANTAIFSVADAVLFRPLPYADADRLQIIRTMDLKTSARYTYVPYSALDAVGRHHDGVGAVAMLETGSSLLVQGEAGAESIPVIQVTPNYFDVAGASAVRGRTFAPHDEAAAGRVALLSHGFWLNELGADESVIGSTITLGTTTLDVLGVLTAGFVFPSGFVDAPDIVTGHGESGSGSGGWHIPPHRAARAGRDPRAGAGPARGHLGRALRRRAGHPGSRWRATDALPGGQHHHGIHARRVDAGAAARLCEPGEPPAGAGQAGRVLAAIVFSAVPAWRAARADPQTSIRSRSRGTPGRG